MFLNVFMFMIMNLLCSRSGEAFLCLLRLLFTRLCEIFFWSIGLAQKMHNSWFSIVLSINFRRVKIICTESFQPLLIY